MKKLVKTSLKLAAASAGAIGGSGYLVFKYVMDRDASADKIMDFFLKFGKTAKLEEPEIPDERVVWFDNRKFETHEIINDRSQKLRAHLLKADKESKIFALCSHGYRNHGRGEFNYMAKFYHDLGINVFMVDHQAAGESEGKYIGFGYYESRDLLKWINYLVQTFGDDIQILLHGVSMGSATVMMASGAANLPANVRFTVADCGYTTALEEFLYNLKLYKVPAHPLIDSADFFNRTISGYSFKDADALSAVKQTKIPMLFIHGTADDFVPTYMGEVLYNACSSEQKKLVLVEGAVHARSYRVNSELYEASVKEYIDKYID